MTTTITQALRAARACIQQDRRALADAHMDPKTNAVDADGAAGVAEYDEVLGLIDEALAESAVTLGPYLFQFDTFNGWVNHAQTAWKAEGVRSDDTLCIDAAGRVCRIGRDFMTARDEGQFPVRVYLMRSDMPQYAAKAEGAAA